MISRRKIFDFQFQFTLRFWNFSFMILKIKGIKTDVPISLNFGYGFLGNKLAKGLCFSGTLLARDLDEGAEFGFYKEWFVKRIYL